MGILNDKVDDKVDDYVDDDYIEYKYNDTYNMEQIYFRSLLNYIFSCCRKRTYTINSS